MADRRRRATADPRVNGAAHHPELDGVEQSSEPEGFELTSADRFSAATVDWLVPELIPGASCTLLEGHKGLGKSTLAATLAADITGGPRFFSGRKRPLGSVLWFTSEEHVLAQTKPKLAAAGADLSRVHFPGRRADGSVAKRLLLPSHLGDLERAIVQAGASLCYLDGLFSFVDGDYKVADPQQARGLMESCNDVAQRTNCVLVLTRHFRKDATGGPLDQGLGSCEIGHVARCVLQVYEHPDDETRRALTVAACNLARKPRTLLYSLVDCKGHPKVKWHGESDLTAEDLHSGHGDAGDRDERLDARALLLLALRKGPQAAADVISEARRVGIGERTLRKSKAKLCKRSKRVRKGEKMIWEWELKEEEK